ncbi:MAG: patatin-like phospholipase family protein [Anaerolineales bacterium]|jgi:NTE family protein
MTTDTNKRNRLALVIGSGSVKCAAGLGMCKVLQREGISADLVVGCSGGGLIASTIALGYSTNDIENLMMRLWTHETVSKFDKRSLLRIIMPRWFGFNENFGLIDDRLMMKSLKDTFSEITFADTLIPLYLVATDLWNGEKVVLNQGLLRDAIRASIASPVIFRPWPVADHLLIDGAMSDPMPVDVAIREGAEVIIAMGFESPYHPQISSLLSYILQMTSVWNNNLLGSTFAFYNLAHHAEIIPIIPKFQKRIDFADTYLIPYIIEEGERATEQHVPYLKRLFAGN